MMAARHEMPGTGTIENPSHRVRYDRDEGFVPYERRRREFCTANKFWCRTSHRSLRDGSFLLLSQGFHAWLPSFSPSGTHGTAHYVTAQAGANSREIQTPFYL